MGENDLGLYQAFGKRFFDIVITSTAVVVLSPLMLITAIVVRFTLGSPIIFKQQRPGKDERIFQLYKFRTMTNEKDSNGRLLPDEERLTKVGKFLRVTSIDELPCLFNILNGDMSLVGPRPLVVKYLPYYTEEERIRHSIRPGLTGLAQVNGRNALSWDEKFAYDLQYVRSLSFLLDIKILLLTVCQLFKPSDVVTRGSGENIDFDQYRQAQTYLGRK